MPKKQQPTPEPTGELAAHMKTRLQTDKHIELLSEILMEAYFYWKEHENETPSTEKK